MFSLSTLLLSTLSLLPVTTLADVTGNDNVAIYWGQNSAGGSSTQQRLSYYCGESASDIVLISFLTSFSGDGTLPTLNVANACEGTYFSGTTLLECDTIAEDIATCQAAGKKVFLSMGGASGAYGISSSDHATALADQLWDLFGGGSSDTRPFGDSIIDGFDLDIEGGSATYYPDFVNAMRANYATDTSKSYYISAAPQCPIPDAYVGAAITNSDIDFLFVQFYNNYCGMQALDTSNFNFEAWDALVKSGSKNANAKVYLGVPGSATAAGSGYVSVDTVVDTALSLQSTYDTFGGVMIWDASQAWNNNDFANVIKAALVSGSSGSTTTSTSSISTTSSTTSTSSTSTSTSTTSVVVVPVTTSSSTEVVTPVASSSSSIVIVSDINKGVQSQTIVSVSSVAAEETSSFSTTSSSSSSSSTTSIDAETTTSTSTISVVPSTTSSLTTSVSTSSSSSLSSSTEDSSAEESSAGTVSVSTVTKSTMVYVYQTGTSVNSDDQTIILLSTQTTTVSGTSTITSNRATRTTSPDSYEVTHVTSTTTVGVTGSVQLASTALIVAAVSGSALQSVSQVGISEVVQTTSSAVGEAVAATTTSTNTSPTTSSSSSSAASSTAVLIADGDACSTIGAMSCSGSQFAVCDNYKWVLRDCAAGTVCYSYGDSLFCGWPGVTYF